MYLSENVLRVQKCILSKMRRYIGIINVYFILKSDMRWLQGSSPKAACSYPTYGPKERIRFKHIHNNKGGRILLSKQIHGCFLRSGGVFDKIMYVDFENQLHPI